MWMTSCPETMGWGFWVIFEKKRLVEIWSWTKRVDFLDLGEASPVGSTRCAARGGVRWNNHHSKNCVSLSPRVENLKVKKVIKVSYPNNESRRCFGIPMHMNISRIRIFYISVSWLCYNNIKRLAWLQDKKVWACNIYRSPRKRRDRVGNVHQLIKWTKTINRAKWKRTTTDISCLNFWEETWWPAE